MPISNKAKMLAHIYRNAAAMGEMEYRQAVLAVSGVESVADREFDEVHFRLLMGRLEALLFERVALGEIPDPIGSNRWIRSSTYWRTEAAKVASPGRITAGQVARITDLWNSLRPHLGDQWTTGYFAAIVKRSARLDGVGVAALTSWQASLVITALQAILRRKAAAVSS